MTVLFGTVEFFEREMLDYAKKKQFAKNSIMEKYSSLKHELLYDFVCDEKLRIECLQNLSIAYQKLLEHDYEYQIV
ncbi:hypothetical protein [Bacillus methanolicus]|uniref:Uncharacterized protein n=1 Tax=Bacillus methanolicus (strain MGA3 / ATCC 53907) TaxID=796606 RepID=I3EBC7_BACMM|nr:hypothetical protein [Bacillus methanolicus]AIE61478.1 hypothetical protein BMMGA3_15625 [Bacillus methanolicus MGA3]EIJ83798.1 hypothetical protein MGA3_00825 [Bacillus methanolicus MGA3]